MKKIYGIIIAIFFMGTSCEDVLNKAPLDIINENVVWNDQVMVDAYILDIYSRMIFLFNDNGTTETGANSIFVVNNLADQSANGRDWEQTYAKWQKGLLAETGGLLEYWDYQNIRRMNDFFDLIETSSIQVEKIKQFKGRIKFARALTYFEMVKRYGGVPLVLKSQSIDTPIEELMVPRNKEVEVYDFIIKECDEIINEGMLLAPQNTPKGDPSIYAAYALKSRAALYAASIARWGKVQINGLVGIPATDEQRFWQIAYDAAKKIIDGPFSLYNKLPNNLSENYRMMMIDESSNPEVIWAKYYDGVNVGHMWDCGNGIIPLTQSYLTANVCPYLEFVEEYENKDGTSSKWDRTSMSGKLFTYDDLYGKLEPRFHAQIYTQGSNWAGINPIQMYIGLRKPDGTKITTGLYNGTPAVGVNTNTASRSLSGFYIKKGVNEKANMASNAGSSQRIQFRLGEILLNYAEAAFYLGKTGDALSNVNKIRTRVGLPAYITIDEGKIRHERKIELAFEMGHRYWDLKRWRIAVDAITRSFTSINYVLDYPTGKFLIEFNSKFRVVSFLEKHYYFPITPARISNSPSLAPENPGY